jgi:hypothetical protein
MSHTHSQPTTPLSTVLRRGLAGLILTTLIGLLHAAAASAAHSPWAACSKAAGNAAARDARLSQVLDADPVLRGDFGATRPSSVYKRPATSLCGDFDGDAHTDRALLYQCCTVSSPAPWLVLRRQGSAWRIAYERLHDTTFKLEPHGTRLVTTEPKYSSSDALCCPSRLRIGTLRWTGRSFKRTFRVVQAKGARSGAVALASSAVYGVQGCTTPRVRPTLVIFACGDAGMLMQHIRWRHWGGSIAVGAGEYSEKTCKPDCATGGSRSHQATVWLGDIGRCPGHGSQRFYRRAKVSGVRFSFPRLCPI